MSSSKVYHGGSGKGKSNFSTSSIPSLDVKVKNTTNDTTADFLSSKLQAGTNVSLSTINSGGDEKTKIDVSIPVQPDEKIKVSVGDTTADYLSGKVQGSSNVSLSIVNPGGNQKIQFDSLDQKVKTHTQDTTPGFLSDKLVAGTAIALTRNNIGANETITVDNTYVDPGTLKTDGTDTTPSYLWPKVQQGNRMTLTNVDVGGGNKVVRFDADVQNGDRKVSVSGIDTTPNYLASKLTAGSNVSLTTLNAGGNEQVQITASTQTGDRKVKVSTNDTTPDFLSSKIVGIGNISVTLINGGGNEQLRISQTGSPTNLEHSLVFGTGTALAVGSFIPPCTEGSSWANGSIGQYIENAATIKEIAIMLPRFVSYNSADSITFQFRRIAASSARGASVLTASSGVSLGTIAITCPNTSGSFWYNNYGGSGALSWSLNAGDILFCVISAMSVNAVTGASLYLICQD